VTGAAKRNVAKIGRFEGHWRCGKVAGVAHVHRMVDTISRGGVAVTLKFHASVGPSFSSIFFRSAYVSTFLEGREGYMNIGASKKIKDWKLF
jgi:hypothetical protein